MLFIIELIIFGYLAACVTYNLVLAVAGKLFKRSKLTDEVAKQYGKVAILIPAYKEDEVIVSTVLSYKKLNYPADKYEVIVIADSLQQETINTLSEMDARVLEVSFEKSTKAKSLNVAFGKLGDDFDMVLISDADNVLAPDFLTKANLLYQKGHWAIQGQRVAKNLDTPFAILDAANEIIANHIYRKGANALGLSSSVIGSGMVFHYPLIKEVLQEIQATGGFDKVLQLLIVERGISIKYLEDAYIYDEKISHSAVFENQRKRWVSSQIVYLRTYWTKGWKALFRGKLNYFNLSVCQNALMPRMLLLFSLTILTLAAFLLQQFLHFSWWWMLGLFIANGLTLLIPIPAKFYSNYLLTALVALPKAMLIMVKLMFRLKGADKTFIHTKHTQTGINNPLLHAPGE
ncbi:glycosyltransferase [Chitinophaga silvatica]|uniref:Glycosyltransferase n=1 Tax=Chitinophaga silvatica TaxID=2282649 RepID=A0A3E1Y4F0_9BACT|nr:glycosyltransferase family 2 protein [Chitinophaga silvatica]RFS19565.1 glycosyltransferase [Chitinophaga silvatica]